MTDRPNPDRGSATDEAADRPEDRGALERIADRTSERVQPDDPYTEPPDSTVDDWFGQRVERDAEQLDEAGSDGAGSGAAAGQDG